MRKDTIPNYKRKPFTIPTIMRRNKYKALGEQPRLRVTPNAKLAVIVHLYYKNLWPVLSERLKNINVPFDLYISVQEANQKITVEKLNQFHGTTNVLVFPNKGRDVLPFLLTAKMLLHEGSYQYFLKLHSKKSLHRTDGNEWLTSLLNELIPNDIAPIVKTLEKGDTGAIGPQGHIVSLTRYLHPNRENIEKILRKLINKRQTKYIVDKASLYPFFGGTMFWGRLDFMAPLINRSLPSIRFEKEKGQVDGTTAHALERVFGGLLHEVTKRKMYTVGQSGVQPLPEELYEDEYRYVG